MREFARFKTQLCLFGPLGATALLACSDTPVPAGPLLVDSYSAVLEEMGPDYADTPVCISVVRGTANITPPEPVVEELRARHPNSTFLTACRDLMSGGHPVLDVHDTTVVTAYLDSLAVWPPTIEVALWRGLLWGSGYTCSAWPSPGRWHLLRCRHRWES